MQLQISETPRFRRSLARASASLQRLVYQEIHHVVAVFEANPRIFARGFDRVERLRPETVLEVKLGGGCRLLGRWRDGDLALLDVGGHEIVGEYQATWLTEQLAQASKAGPAFWPSQSPIGKVFGSSPDARFSKYGTETDPEWIYFLAEEQERLVELIEARLAVASSNDPAFFIVVGGPGTGKTSILLKLLVDLTANGLSPAIALSDPLADYVETSGSIDLGNVRIDMAKATGASLLDRTDDRFNVLLIDDPRWVWEIERALDNSIGRFVGCVLAFDPSQLDDDLSDTEYVRLITSYEVTALELATCYRQKATVGLAARRVMQQIASRGPFFEDRNVDAYLGEHELVYRISNELEYPNPFGYEQTYLNPTDLDVRGEIERIMSGPLWRHAPPVLVVLADFPTHASIQIVGDNPETEDNLSSLEWWDRELRGTPARFTTLYDLQEIKGLEFQHVILVLTRGQYDELESAPAGSNQRGNRLMRIPFSRAKDSLVTFVVGGRPRM